MRSIGQVIGAKKAYLFVTFLSSKGIEASSEKSLESPSSEEEAFAIWVVHEDQVKEAEAYLAEFLANPNDPQFAIKEEVVRIKPSSSEEEEGPIPKIKSTFPSSKAPFTRFLIVLCAALFILSMFQMQKVKLPGMEGYPLTLTPIFLTFSYDVPEKWIRLKALLESDELKEGDKKGAVEYEKIEALPSWNGLYEIALHGLSSQEKKAPPFKKISQGEVWRLITPILLHGGLLHILFNMLWLYMLGKQLEERLKVWQYLAITVIIGIISNTVQYLMSGPAFAGYSGVLCGLVGFIWMRQRMAPWEGYPLQPMTIAILFVFVMGLVLLQMISFVFVRFDIAPFSLGIIANSAHVSGGICGLILGRIPFFSKGAV